MLKNKKSRDLHESARQTLDAELMQVAAEDLDCKFLLANSKNTKNKNAESYRGALLQDMLGIFSVILKLPIEKIDIEETISTYGVDSIIITEIMRRIANTLQISISAAIFFEAKNIVELADIIIERFGEQVIQFHGSHSLQNRSFTTPTTPSMQQAYSQKYIVSPKAKAPSLTSKSVKSPMLEALIAKSRSLSKKCSNFTKKNTSHNSDHIETEALSRQLQITPINKIETDNVSPESIMDDQKTKNIAKTVKNTINSTKSTEKHSNYEPIAIIGMDGIFAQSSNLEELQRNLYQGKDCISEIPKERWDWQAHYGDPKNGEFTNVKYGGFIKDVDKFDPDFFGISPREAQTMDPQHRLFLECTWQLIESSGYSLSSFTGKKIGIFVGINLQDYAEIVLDAQCRDVVELTSIPHMFCPNRISYLLDINGPSEIIDTACSSSLVAIHRAAMSIQQDACTMAIAGGSNLILSPKMHILYSKAEMICEDGRCKTFSKNANGYVRSEGVGAILLKRLKDAEADHDNILGVMISSTENHGGRATSLMAPNPKAQAQLILDAHKKAKVDPRSISYVECHGTGTTLGDPIEINGLKIAFEALYQEYGLGQAVDNHCALGSIKSNIGHTETAAGVAGVIKVLLAMRDEYLPRSLHSQELNPLIELAGSPFYILQEGRTWQRPDIDKKQQPLRAGVSSFGAGGSNAHLVIEEYHNNQQTAHLLHSPEIIVLSAKNLEQLTIYAQKLLNYTAKNMEFISSHFKPFAYTLQIGRNILASKIAFIAEDVAELKHKLALIIKNPHQAAHSDDNIFISSDSDEQSELANFVDSSDIQRWWETQQWKKVAQAWVDTKVDWLQLYADQQYQRLPLPTSPFDKQRYWIKKNQKKINNKILTADNKESAKNITTSTLDGIPISDTSIPSIHLDSDKSVIHSVKISLTPLIVESVPSISASSKHIENKKNQAKVPVRLKNGVKKNSSASLISSIIQQLKESLASALYVTVDEINVNKLFSELGLDSIIGAEWINNINKVLGTKLSATCLYDYATIQQLAQYIVKESVLLKKSHMTLLNKSEKKQPKTLNYSSIPTAVNNHSSLDIAIRSKNNEIKYPTNVNTINNIQKILVESLAAVLCTEAETLSINRPFSEIGLDSIVGVEWVHSINNHLNTHLSATQIYKYPNIQLLTEYIANQYHGTKEFNSVKSVSSKTKRLLQNTVISAAVSNQTSNAISKTDVNTTVSLERSAEIPLIKTKTNNSMSNTIAIIGMSGRYPDAENLEQYWNNLVAGHNAIREVPQDRWDVNQYFDTNRDKVGKIYCKWLGALSDIDCFDPLFFSISPSEAEGIDPQHRLFLQESYKAFEDAGYSPKDLHNKKCGVYMGIMSYEYAHMMQSSVSPLSGTGNSFAIGAARISYFLNLKGPAIPVDTACSSSLVTTHLACQALNNSEIDLALVGGVSLYLMPETYIGMCSAGMLSAAGQCKTFDNSADGFVPGEGVGSLILKRLVQAESDADHIYGVIIGSGINQDGKTNGITAPSVNSQIELEREIYQKYYIDPNTISYIETHGTGTKLGDPIELEALTSVFKAWTDHKKFCALGSVKSNIGHTSAASGIASIQKVLLSMKYKQLVPSLHFSTPNQHFNFEDSPFYVNTQVKSWQSRHGKALRAAVSSFGYSGTNAHLVIEEYITSSIKPKNIDIPVIITLSAMYADRLSLMAQNLLTWISVNNHSVIDLQDLAYTLQVGRQPMDERLAFIVSSIDELKDKLKKFLSDDNIDSLLFRHHVNYNDQTYKIFADDSEFSNAIDQWTRQKDLNKITKLWITGLHINWNLLYIDNENEQVGHQPRRISLPTYPFAKQSYWFEKHSSSTTVHSSSLPIAASETSLSRTPVDLTEKKSEIKQWFKITEAWVESVIDSGSWLERIDTKKDDQILVISQKKSVYHAMQNVLQKVQKLANIQESIWNMKHIAVKAEAADFQHISIELLSIESTKPLVVFLMLSDRQRLSNLEYQDLELIYSCVQAVQKIARLRQVQFYCCYQADYTQSLKEEDLQNEALSGLFRSAILESINHSYRSIIVDSSLHNTGQVILKIVQEWLCDIKLANRDLTKNALAMNSPSIRFSDGHRYELKVSEDIISADEDITSDPALIFRSSATYLMVGALGDTGEQVCKVLGQTYQAQLIIFSRRPESQVFSILTRIRASGAKVIYRAVDILNLESMIQAIQALKAENIILNGVVHMAREVSDGLIVNKSFSEFQQMIASKVIGTLNVDVATAQEPLEFFLMFSSVAAFGIQGASDYAYASAFQNTFARHREKLVNSGQRYGVVCSICWGQWEVDGAIDNTLLPDRLERLAKQGMGSIDSVTAVKAIQQEITNNVVALVIVTDLTKVRNLMGLRSDLLKKEEHIADVPETNHIQSSDTAERNIRQAISQFQKGKMSQCEFANFLSSLSLEELNTSLKQEISSVIELSEQKKISFHSETSTIPKRSPKATCEASQIDKKIIALNIDPEINIRDSLTLGIKKVMKITDLDWNKPLQDYGMDSIIAMQLSTTLEKQLKFPMQPNWLIEYPTPNLLMQKLSKQAEMRGTI